ncbi:MAG: hypothetical protein HYZ17_03860 [Betaproteobacteria bacterium]|nr:hypothetical protein [Betaproteobacteria bacterium]
MLHRVLAFTASALMFSSSLAIAGQSIDDILMRCPSNGDLAALTAQFGISFERDASTGQIACESTGSSPNLSPVQKRAYNTLLGLREIRFDAPLPFSGARSLFEWLSAESGLKGIRYRGDLSFSFCCDPEGVINIAVDRDSGYLKTDKWFDAGKNRGLLDEAGILVHFARHIKGGDHDCNGQDTTVERQGPWGAQYQALLWLGNHVDREFLRPAGGSIPYDLYRDMARQRAEELRATRFCQDTRQIETVQVVEFLDRATLHYFMTADPAEIAMLESGAVGRDWVRTGFSFNAFKSAETAPATALPVCRFRGRPGVGPSSHLFGLSTEECALARSDIGWIDEGTPFYMVKATWSNCPTYAAGKKTFRVWRAYNNKFAANDANFRHTIATDSYFDMQRHGWAMQGVAMCAAE